LILIFTSILFVLTGLIPASETSLLALQSFSSEIPELFDLAYLRQLFQRSPQEARVSELESAHLAAL